MAAGFVTMLEHLDLQLHVDVTSICGDGIPASILNHTAAVTELLPMPPSEKPTARACHHKVSQAEAAKAGCPPLVRRAGVQVRRRARRAGVIQRES